MTIHSEYLYLLSNKKKKDMYNKTFNSKKELLKSAIDNGILYSNSGVELHFDLDSFSSPMIVSDGNITSWDELTTLKWSTHKPFKNQELVWAWDDGDLTNRQLRVWDKENEAVFSCDGKQLVYRCQNYAPYEGEILIWMLDMINNCK